MNWSDNIEIIQPVYYPNSEEGLRDTVTWDKYWVETFLKTLGRQYIYKLMFIVSINSNFRVIEFIHKCGNSFCSRN